MGKARSEKALTKSARPTSGRQGRRVIALTGVNTFLGRHLVALLERTRAFRRIVAIDLEAPSTAGPKTRFYKVDLTQPAVDARLAEILQAEKVDTMVHGAFLEAPSHAAAWAHELESVGTMHILGACEETGVRKVIVRSHTMLYGARADNAMYLDEDQPLRGDKRWSFVGDKIDAEKQAQAFARRQPDSVVTVLRAAPTVGPSARNLVTELFAWRVVPMVLGRDPLVQLVHELDLVAAFKIAIDEDHPGVFNVVAPGVLPLSSVVRLAGRVEVFVPTAGAKAFLQVLFTSRLSRAAPDMLEYLTYPFVASGERAQERLGFRATYTTREALGDHVRSRRSRQRDILLSTHSRGG